MLIPTSQFVYGTYKFSHFNQLQSICFPFHDKDVNLVVAAATSAGKTIVAEQNIAYAIANGKKAIFLSPLKSVTQEKYDDWTDPDHYFSKYKIEIITGDYRLTEDRVANIQKADLILMTSEMLDTRTRYFSSESNTWIKEVGVLAVDEAHLLCTNRGPALEVGLMRFTQLNLDAKVLLLSATMTNSSALGTWLTTLNGKHTEVIHTDWRPVELHHHHLKSHNHTNVQARQDMILNVLRVLTCPYTKLASYATSPNSSERSIAEIRMQGIRQDKDSKDAVKTLVFVHTKDEGRKLVDALEGHGITAHFHNADLGKADRLKLEKKFREEELNVLIATSTLAWGINMPARHVIVSGNKRGPDMVSDIDIKQMVGRAGRFGMYHRGDAFLVCNPEYSLSDKFVISSSLGDTHYLSFHLIAEMFSGTFNTLAGASAWYRRSFNAIVDPRPDLIRKALDQLVLHEALVMKDGVYRVTMYGKIARDLYLFPEDIYNWKRNFQAVTDWTNPIQIADAFTKRISTFEMDYVPRELQSLSGSYKMNGGKALTKNMAYACVSWYRLKRGTLDSYVVKTYDAASAMYVQTIAKDSGRIFGALQRLNRHELWNRENELKAIQARIAHGVGEHLLELVSIPGIGEIIATQLYAAGIKDIPSLIKEKDNLEKFITRKGNITKILKGLEQFTPVPAVID